jgi:DNA primase
MDVDGRQVTISHPDKVVFPAADGRAPVTKGDLVSYYLAVAGGALRGVADRPMILKRFVRGITEEAVFQKRAPAKRPDFVDVAELKYASGTSA